VELVPPPSGVRGLLRGLWNWHEREKASFVSPRFFGQAYAAPFACARAHEGVLENAVLVAARPLVPTCGRHL